MAQSNQELSAKLANQGAAMTPLAFDHKLAEWYKANGKRLTTFAGSDKEARRFMTALIYVASRNRALLECDMMSLGDCLLQSAQLKLYPGPLNECAYVPYKGRAQFQAMYQGLIKLAYNTGLVKNIQARVVYTADDFDYSLGSPQYLKHRPFLGDEPKRGEAHCVYCIIEMSHGTVIELKSMDWVESIRKRSPSGKNEDSSSPWKTDYDEMAIKSILKYALKKVPKSAELATVLEIDNEEERPELAQKKIIDIDESAIMPEIKKEEGNQEKREASIEKLNLG